MVRFTWTILILKNDTNFKIISLILCFRYHGNHGNTSFLISWESTIFQTLLEVQSSGFFLKRQISIFWTSWKWLRSVASHGVRPNKSFFWLTIPANQAEWAGLWNITIICNTFIARVTVWWIFPFQRWYIFQTAFNSEKTKQYCNVAYLQLVNLISNTC